MPDFMLDAGDYTAEYTKMTDGSERVTARSKVSGYAIGSVFVDHNTESASVVYYDENGVTTDGQFNYWDWSNDYTAIAMWIVATDEA